MIVLDGFTMMSRSYAFMHRPYLWHAQTPAYIYLYIHTDTCSERERHPRERAVQAGHLISTWPRCWYKRSFLYRYISKDSLSSQASSSLATIHRTSSAALVKPHSLASCLCFSTAAPAHSSNQLQPILVPGKKIRTGGMGDVKWHG